MPASAESMSYAFSAENNIVIKQVLINLLI
jgi:hypothetical protein